MNETLKRAFEIVTTPLFACTVLYFDSSNQITDLETTSEGHGYQVAEHKTLNNNDQVIIVPTGAQAKFTVDGEIVTVNDFRPRPGHDGDTRISFRNRKFTLRDEGRIVEINWIEKTTALYCRINHWTDMINELAKDRVK